MSLWLKSAENQDENENSDSSDEDYVPGDAPDVSEEEDDGDDEPALDNNEGNDGQSSANKPRAKRKQPRKRGVAESRGALSVSDSEEAREAEVKRLKTEAEQEKLRADKLFADFMSDVGRPRDRVKQQVSVSPADSDPVTSTGVSSRLTASDSTSSVKPSIATSSSPSPTVPPSVNNTAARSDVNSCPPSLPASGDIRANIKLASSSVAEVKPAPGAPRRRGGALSALVGSINKPAKMNVLQRSSLDWDRFKDDTGAHEELQKHVRSKDAYLEKQDFLMRTDQRQFEQEKAMRDRHRTPRV